MRKILVVVGSGIKNGNTDKLADAFIKGAAEKGHEVQKVFVGNSELHGCLGCAACQMNGNKCVVQDMMQEIYPYVKEYETIVLASPLYFWTWSSQIKTFFDRLYALSTEDIYPKKECAFLMTAGDDRENTFQHADEYYQFITKALGWENIGTYYAGGCQGAVEGRFIDEKHIQNAYEFGKSI